MVLRVRRGGKRAGLREIPGETCGVHRFRCVRVRVLVLVCALVQAACATAPRGTFVTASNATNTASDAPRNNVHRRLVVRHDRACYIGDDRLARCWGENRMGALGRLGALRPYTQQRQEHLPAGIVPGLGPVRQLSLEESRTCALREDRTVVCFGGAMCAMPGAERLRVIDGLTEVVQLTSGLAFTCALHRNGTVSCFAADGVEGNVASSHCPFTSMVSSVGLLGCQTPRRVQGLEQVEEISAGMQHLCARLRNGMVQCLGDGSRGQLGPQELPLSRSDTPLFVRGVSGAIALASGATSSCVITDAQRVHCWGSLYEREYSETSAQSFSLPSEVPGLTNATHLSLGTRHGCALRADASVWCWGATSYQELGEDFSELPSPARSVAFFAGAQSITTAEGATCFIDGNQQVQCVGDNRYGVLGMHPEQLEEAEATRVALSSPSSFLAAADDLYCSASDQGPVGCWGDRLGFSNSVVEIPGTEQTEEVAISDDSVWMCTRNQNQTVHCFLLSHAGSPGFRVGAQHEVPSLHGAVGLDLNETLGCGAVQNSVRCVSYSPSRMTPTVLTGAGIPGNPLWISSHYTRRCLATQQQLVGCDGLPFDLPRGTDRLQLPNYTFFPVFNGSVRMEMGLRFACGLRANGDLRCFGQYFDEPLHTMELHDVTDMSAEHDHACAVFRDGSVQCWGNRLYQWTGRGIGFERRPALVSALHEIVQVAVGARALCGRTRDGAVFCLGSRAVRGLNDPLREGLISPTPVVVAGL